MNSEWVGGCEGSGWIWRAVRIAGVWLRGGLNMLALK